MALKNSSCATYDAASAREPNLAFFGDEDDPVPFLEAQLTANVHRHCHLALTGNYGAYFPHDVTSYRVGLYRVSYYFVSTDADYLSRGITKRSSLLLGEIVSVEVAGGEAEVKAGARDRAGDGGMDGALQRTRQQVPGRRDGDDGFACGLEDGLGGAFGTGVEESAAGTRVAEEVVDGAATFGDARAGLDRLGSVDFGTGVGEGEDDL